jgi:hypothetical protein
MQNELMTNREIKGRAAMRKRNNKPGEIIAQPNLSQRLI